MVEETGFTHFTKSGDAHMVAVGEKPESRREALAVIFLSVFNRAALGRGAAGVGSLIYL